MKKTAYIQPSMNIIVMDTMQFLAASGDTVTVSFKNYDDVTEDDDGDITFR